LKNTLKEKKYNNLAIANKLRDAAKLFQIKNDLEKVTQGHCQRYNWFPYIRLPISG